MIKCEHCGRGHKKPEAVEACAKRAAKHKEREERLAADKARREANAAKRPVAQYIRERWARDQTPWVNVVSGLNNDYPPPEGKKKWTLADAIAIDNERLNWPF